MREQSTMPLSPSFRKGVDSYSRSNFFYQHDTTVSRRSQSEPPLIEAIKKGDRKKIMELLKRDTSLLGDPNLPILMLLTDNGSVKRLLAASIKREIKKLENEGRATQLDEWQKIILVIFYLNLAIYYHTRLEYQERFNASGCKLFKKYQIYSRVSACWKELISHCSDGQAHDFAKLGTKIGKTYLKIKENEEAIGYFENTINLEQKSNHQNEEAKRSRLMYLANSLTIIYFNEGCKKRPHPTSRYQLAIINNIFAAKSNLLMLNLAREEEHKLCAIQRFISIYQVVLKYLTLMNEMEPIHLREKEDPETLSITLDELAAQTTKLLEAIAQIKLANPILGDDLERIAHKIEDEIIRFLSIYKPSPNQMI